MDKKIAVYPGTFDPVTHGHLDLLSRASFIFEEVIVALSTRSSKKTLFSLDERLELLKKVISDQKFHCPVTVKTFDGLLVNFATENKAKTLVRGLRAVSDFEYEYQMALMNRHLAPSLETVYLMPDEKYVYLSSTLIKEVARLGGDLKKFLPSQVIDALHAKR